MAQKIGLVIEEFMSRRLGSQVYSYNVSVGAPKHGEKTGKHIFVASEKAREMAANGTLKEGQYVGSVNLEVHPRRKSIEFVNFQPFFFAPPLRGNLLGSTIHAAVIARVKKKFPGFTVKESEKTITTRMRKAQYQRFGVENPKEPMGIETHFKKVRDYLRKMRRKK